MTDFKICIAGQVAAVSAQFQSTRDYCHAYLTDAPADFSVAVSREDMEFEQKMLYEEALAEGMRVRRFPDPFLDRAAVQRKVAEALIGCGTLLFHGSAVAVDGQGYLFTAKCGTGKSTHTRLWRQRFGSRAVMINDDKPFLRITPEAVLVCGAPWSGKHGLDTNLSVPLRGICILERGQENRIRRAEPEEKAFVYTQSCRPLDDSRLKDYLLLVDALAERVPLWHMECTKEPRAAEVSYRTMCLPL